jgi:hypothetical protein
MKQTTVATQLILLNVGLALVASMLIQRLLNIACRIEAEEFLP